MTNESFSVRPRMKASGATSMVPRSIIFLPRSKSTMSYSASYSGRRYGLIFSAKSPGRKPSFSPASTAGRVSTTRCTCAFTNAATATAIARYVLPVPAGPMPNTMSYARMASMYVFCAMLLGVIVRRLDET